MKNALIIGATSGIAKAVIKELLSDYHSMYLIARDQAKLSVVTQDLKVRGSVKLKTAVFDLSKVNQHKTMIAGVYEDMENIDLVLIAHGALPGQADCDSSYENTYKCFETNFLSVVSLLIELAPYFEQQKKGTIAVITSVAGDRGRQRNLAYGTAKGATSTFLQGFRQRLFRSHVDLIDIRPGYVDTPMVAHLKKGFLWATPEQVAKDIVKAIKKRKAVLYTPFYWYFIIGLIKLIPERIFKRLSF